MGFLQADFFQRDFLTVARELVGVELLWRGCSGIIVETEGYAVEETQPVTQRPVKVRGVLCARCPQGRLMSI